MSSNFEFLLKQLNLKLQNSSLFYVSNDPERAMGLEDLIENFHLVCVDDSNLLQGLDDAGVKYFSLEQDRFELNSLYRNSAKLLLQPETKEYIKANKSERNYYQTFKVSSRFEKLMDKPSIDGVLLNTTSELNKLFEEKLTQFEELNPAGVNFPQTLIGQFGEFDYGFLKNELGKNFVVQFNRGHTGKGTIFVKTK
ncbi:hypothetical protein GF389_05475, partial [Candidatus Dojkabacteria bacterium]|nr:hypothetical protein [Candidatus Dojkabacteria bacterium]